MRRKPYDEILGLLQFAANLTRSDIAFAVNLLSRFKTNPGKQHWEGAKHIVRYLKSTIDGGILYSNKFKNNSLITTYSDVDWADDQDDRKSTSGYITMMHGEPVTWTSRKQECNALFTLESEYIVVALAVPEIIWLRRLVTSLENKDGVVELLCDNQGTIHFT